MRERGRGDVKSLTLHWGEIAIEQMGLQRPKKSKLSGWQLSTRKNFPDEVRKSFLRQNKVRK